MKGSSATADGIDVCLYPSSICSNSNQTALRLHCTGNATLWINQSRCTANATPPTQASWYPVHLLPGKETTCGACLWLQGCPKDQEERGHTEGWRTRPDAKGCDGQPSPESSSHPIPTPTPSPNTMPKANPNPWAESPPVEPSSQPACQWCQKEQKNHSCGAWSQPVSHHSSLTALGPGINRWWERSSGLCPTQWAEYLLPPPHRSIFALSLRGVINIHSELSRIRFPMHEDVYYLFIFKAC